MLYWKFLAEGSTVAGNPRLGGGEENPPVQDPQLLPPLGLAHPLGHLVPGD